MFQSLVGTLKTRNWFWNSNCLFRFQSLVGTLKTCCYVKSWWYSGVSIPRRYAKNQVNCLHEVISITMFQSLVGTLKTQFHLCQWSIPCRFQSLVGTLKTMKTQPVQLADKQVSIPRRYAKNPSGLFWGLKDWHVSIPRRYAKNCQPGRLPRSPRSFQSLVGTLKTISGPGMSHPSP